MKTVTQHLRDRLLAFSKPTLEELYRTEWVPMFEKFMRNRLVIGAFRYGKIGHKPDYDYIGSLIKRAELYTETGNQEHLVDVANFAMLEFVDGKHPKKHMRSVDGHDYRTTIKEPWDRIKKAEDALTQNILSRYYGSKGV